MKTIEKATFRYGIESLTNCFALKGNFLLGTLCLILTINLNVYAHSGKEGTPPSEKEKVASLPTAANVTFTGNLAKGETLTGSYEYNDADGDPEDGSTYQWYAYFITPTFQDTGYVTIPGANSLTYTIADQPSIGIEGYSIAFSVTPKNGSETGEEVWSEFQGPVLGEFAGGNGSSSNPYQINQAYQLNNVRDHSNDDFVLTADIDLTEATGAPSGAYWNDGDGWEPIDNLFGELDGNGFRITGLHISGERDDEDVGLFAEIGIDGTVKNLGLEDVTFGDEEDLSSSTGENVGGIAGINRGTITNSYVTGDFNGDYEYLGGLVGQNRGFSSSGFSTISLSHADVNINSSGYTGGLVGENINYATISTSYSTGSVNTDFTSGGLVGVTQFNAKISNSFSTADVSGEDKAGGLAGSGNNTSYIENSYSTGTVSGAESMGGLVGVFASASETASGNFWDTETSGIATSATGTGKTTSEMKTEATFTDADWDFDDIWTFQSNHNNGYPVPEGNVPNEYPSVSGVSFSGDLIFGDVLTASYSYSDPEGDSEDGTTFQWYRTSVESIEDVGSFTLKSEISGATSSTYTITNNDVGKYISVSVIPSDEFDNGIRVESETQEVIGGEFAGGSGTSEDPYQINEAYQLDHVRDHLSNYFILTADIDLSEATGSSSGIFWNSGNGWDPIGGQAGGFTGHFDGNQHVIDGVYINRGSEDAVGLFGLVSGSGVSDLGVTNVDISGKNFTGGLVGFLQGSAVTKCYVSGAVTGFDSVGGLVGNSDDQHQEPTISQSYAAVDVAATYNLGGLAGTNRGTVQNSYATGQVNTLDGETNLNHGGLVGNHIGSVINSYSIGRVVLGTGGGLTGNDGGGTASNSYWNTETSEKSTSTGTETGLTSAQMLDSGNFEGWDFDDVWEDNGGFSFPVLKEVGNHLISGLELTGSEDWRMMSSPMPGITYGELLDSLWTQGFEGADYEEGTSNVYTWNEAAQQFESISSADDEIPSGAGILVYVFDDQDFNGSADGFPKMLYLDSLQTFEDITLDLSYTDAGAANSIGWNLVGNPYGFPIEWGAGAGWTKTNMDASFYVWNSGAGEYQSHNGSSGTLADDHIAPWQGFWIKATTDVPTLTFKKEARTTIAVMHKEKPVPVIHFTLEGNGLSSGTVLQLDERAQTAKDRLDAYKLASLNADYLSLFTQLGDGSALDINALPAELDEPVSIPIGFDGSNLSGEFELAWELEAFPDDWQFTLRDNETGQEVDVRRRSELSFELAKAKSSKVLKTLEDSPDQHLVSPRHGVMAPKVMKTSGEEAPRFTLTILSGNTVSTEPDNELPDKFALSQNYPNPFNPSTVIRYQLPVNSEVDLRVFDMLGRSVATLVDGRKQAGTHQATFDASNLASGMYIYRLKAGNTVFTKKLTLIK